MDPNENLKQIRNTVADIFAGNASVDYANDLAELVNALDAWLTKGGAPPLSWRQHDGS